MKVEIDNITYRVEFRHEHLQINLPRGMSSSHHSAEREQQLRMFIASQLKPRYAAGVESITTATVLIGDYSVRMGARLASIGYAFRQSTDPFTPETGRRIALRRALGTNRDELFPTPVRTAIWRAYFNRLPTSRNPQLSTHATE